MGLPSALERVSPEGRPSSAAAVEFLQQLDVELPSLQQELLAEARAPIGSQPSKRSKRLDELANRVRNLAAHAVSYGHGTIAEELGMCEAIVDSASLLGAFDAADAGQLEESLERVSTCLASAQERERTPTSGPVAPVEQRLSSSMLTAPQKGGQEAARIDAGWALQVAPTVLVVAPDAVVDGLKRSSGEHSDGNAPTGEGRVLEIESVADPLRAPELARALAPDVVVIDLELSGASPLVEALLDGPLTATVPIIALGTWETAEQAAPVVAQGVARTLAKPVSPDSLRKACLEIASNPTTPKFEPLGETTLDRLGGRLAEELQHGLCSAADDKTRSMAIDIGQGTEVMAALWGAIARIRELVSASSQGRVQFVPTGPEAALPVAPWLSGGGLRPVGERPSAGHEVRRAGAHALVGRTIVVAEDDLSVNWYLSGILRQAGANVLEARDGVAALDHAYRQNPDLIISDILMPGLDGFALCRAVKRDVLLRDVPVILLSWKEDLLQRVRELGAGAEGYLRKEASGDTIVRRVAEVLSARSEVAARIEEGGPVRGRLDGLTAYSLLTMVCKLRPNACLTVRDALFLYEIQVRSGRPVRATRTSVDGQSCSGPSVIAALLGSGLGRFGVVDSDDAVDDALEGSLEQQLDQPVANARAAQLLLSGPALLDVEQVAIDDDYVAAYGDSSPKSARELLRALAGGSSPRELVQSGRASSHMVEIVLGDAVRYGAVNAIGVDGDDALAPTAKREMLIRRGAADAASANGALRALVRAATHFDATSVVAPEQLDKADGLLEEPRSAPPEALCAEPSVPDAAVPEIDSSTEDVPAMDPEAPLRSDPSSRTPILASRVAVASPYRGASRTVGTQVEDPVAIGASAQPIHNPIVDSDNAARPAMAMAAPVAAAEPVVRQPGPSGQAADPGQRPAQQPVAPIASPAVQAEVPIPPESPVPQQPRVHMPSAFAPDSTSHRAKRPRSRFVWPIVFGVLGISLAVGARWMREQPSEPPSVPAEQQPLGAPQDLPSTPPAPAPAATESEQAKTHDGDLPRELALAEGDEVGKGEGMLEVVAGKSDEIYVNGKLIGKGPVVKVTLKAVPDPYEVRVKLRGEERVRYAVVKDGKRVKLRIAPPWSR